MRLCNLLAVLFLVALSGLEATAGWCCCKGGDSRSYATPTYTPAYSAVSAVTYCWYCDYQNGWVQVGCDKIGNYDPMLTAKTATPRPPTALCLNYGPGPITTLAAGPVEYYPMVCDKHTHRLRFPRCCEVATEFYPIGRLGHPCSPTCDCR